MAGRPSQSIAGLSKKPLRKRAVQVANLISGGHQNHNISEEQLENFFQQVKFQLGFRSHEQDSTHGKVYSAQNKIPIDLKLTPLQDLMICNNRLTWRGRESLKSELLKHGKDIFAPTRQVEEQLQYYSSFGKIEQFNYDEGKTSYYLFNIHEYLQIRLKNIWKNGLFLTLRDKIILCVSGDKGGKYTKICLQIGNTVNPNSSGSIILLAMYENSDTHDILASSCQNVLQQLQDLKFATFIVQEEPLIQYETEMFITGDFKFLYGIYGHIGVGASFNCIFCEAPRNNLKPTNVHTLRTLTSITTHFHHHQDTLQPQLSANQITNLNKICKSISRQPLTNIDIDHIIPPTIHIIQGLCVFLTC